MKTYQRCCDTELCEAGDHIGLLMVSDVLGWLCRKELHGKAAELREDIKQAKRLTECPSCGRFVTVEGK